MEGASEAPQMILVAASGERLGQARATVRSALAAGGPPCLVIDLMGGYAPVGPERVLSFRQIAESGALRDEAARAAATLEPDELELYAGAAGAAYALGQGTAAVLVLRAGVRLLRDPGPLLAGSTRSLVVPGTDSVGAVRRAAAGSPVTHEADHRARLTLTGPGAGPLHSRSLVVLAAESDAVLLRTLAADWRLGAGALDVFALEAGAAQESDETLLIGPWRQVPPTRADAAGRLIAGGSAPYALDLSGLDPRRPWLLDATVSTTPRVLLSEHPELARLAAREAGERLADPVAVAGGSPHRTLDPALRAEARRCDAGGSPLPDVLGLGVGPGLDDWALELVPSGEPRPLARYLFAVWQARPDLQRAFRRVPGGGSQALATWASEQGPAEDGYDADLLARAAARTLASRAPSEQRLGVPAPGVNLVGYLTGELGVGTSARLVDQALQAAGVPTSTDDVGTSIASRRGARFRRSDRTVRRTTLLCVNAAETSAVAQRRAALLESTRVIGMWYWELEDFPASQHAGFAHVDEVWVATDFMRAAIARHAGEVPVRTVTPPLPQAGPDPGPLPERFGIPTSRPWFLFTFDFLSFAERKNPLGLVEAFDRAFGELPVGERPTLVIKTINADRHPGDAERLRLRIAGRPDLMLLDTYLADHERHVLVAHCTAYVSLHRAEGLGLTVAEAMAWGRPVITTGYGGVTQFCDEQNAFLVDWAPCRIEESVGPYESGSTWAEPDLDHAARLMRLVVADPARAAAVGERAARDIRERHNADVAGARMRELLREGDERWAAGRAVPGDAGPEVGPDDEPVGEPAPGVGGLTRRLRSVVRSRRVGR